MQESLVRFPPTPPDFLDSSDKDADNNSIQFALHVLKTESDALKNLHSLYLTDLAARRKIVQAIHAIITSSSQGGRIVVSGVGKSGKIGKKFVATLNSLAIRSAFLHPTEAMHGDLGMIGPNDVLIILSYSGRTSELILMLEYIPADLSLIAITSHADSSSCPLLIKRPPTSCILLPVPIPVSEFEAFGVPAPTSSTTTTLALTDALALAVASRLHPDPRKVFQLHHPGGAIGANAVTSRPRLMNDITIKTQDIPIIPLGESHVDSTVLEALLTAARSTSGWVRPSSETVLSPRQIQRIGRQADPSEPLRLLGAGIIVEKSDWISIEGANSIQEARDWILRMRRSDRGKTFLKRGTVLGIVDEHKHLSGVVEIEEIMAEDELKE
ncbi:MAG: hypothetical protein Q9195_006434 [Heterodermia aff. obscurata]